MEDILKVGENAYEFPEDGKIRNLDTRLFETERMGAVLETIIDKLERMVPPGRTLALMNPAQRAAAREELISAQNLFGEFGYHYDECMKLGHPLVDAPTLSEAAQSTALEKLLKLTDLSNRLSERLTVLAIRMGAEAAGSNP